MMRPVILFTAARRPACRHLIKELSSGGAFYLNLVQYLVGTQYGFQRVLVITNGDTLTVTNPQGQILIEHTRPAPGTAYVGNAKPPGPHTNNPDRHRSPETSTVTDVLMQNCHRCPETSQPPSPH
jgi:putative transposase